MSTKVGARAAKIKRQMVCIVLMKQYKEICAVIESARLDGVITSLENLALSTDLANFGNRVTRVFNDVVK